MYFITFFISLYLTISTLLHAGSLADEKVITIHGIFGSPWNMYYLAGPLENEKMEVIHWGYPSRDKKILDHAEDLVIMLQQEAEKQPGKAIHFLTHSMGGLILRAAINHPDCPTEALIGNAVLLAPPNQGSAWGRLISEFAFANQIGKDQAASELMNQENFEHLGQFPETMKVMVIAGNAGINPFIPGPNDGTVGVEETRLTTPHCHEVIFQGHKSILLSKTAALLSLEFFKEQISEF